MQSNQKDNSSAAAASLAAMQAAIAAGAAKWAPVAERANLREPLRRRAGISRADLPGWLLTKAQGEGIAMQQELCRELSALIGKINENTIVYELALPPLESVVVADRLLQIDGLIQKSGLAAEKLGVEPVQAKLRFALYDARPQRRQAAKAA